VALRRWISRHRKQQFSPYPFNTPLTLAGQRTYYFRTTFTVANLASFSALQLDHAIDDAAVFYLNGEEFYRFNLPEGTITYSTQPSDQYSARLDPARRKSPCG
jgi:hypothetical protein